MGFSRQEYWSGLPFPSLGIFLTQGWHPGLLHCGHTPEPPGNSLSFRENQLFVSLTLTDFLVAFLPFIRICSGLHSSPLLTLGLSALSLVQV